MYNVSNKGTGVQRILEITLLTLQLFSTSKTVLKNKLHLIFFKLKQNIHINNNNNNSNLETKAVFIFILVSGVAQL